MKALFVSVLLTFTGLASAAPITQEYCMEMTYMVEQIVEFKTTGATRDQFRVLWGTSIAEGATSGSDLLKDQEDMNRAMEIGLSIWDSDEPAGEIPSQFLEICTSKIPPPAKNSI